jgi:hypothetical protein
VSRPALGPTQPPVQWVPGVLSPGLKARPGRDADHLPPSSAEVVNEWEIYLLSPQATPWRVAGLLYLFFINHSKNIIVHYAFVNNQKYAPTCSKLTRRTDLRQETVVLNFVGSCIVPQLDVSL